MAQTEVAQDDAPAASPVGRRSALQFAAGMVLSTLIAAGLGGGFGLQLARKVEDAVKAKGVAAEKKVETAFAGPTHLKPLRPIITNLAEPAETWIRLEASIVFVDAEIATDEVLAGAITEDILAYLRTLTVAQIEGPSGIQYLREDLDERVRLRSDGRVGEIVIQTLVVQ